MTWEEQDVSEDQLWASFEARFIELDEVRDDESRQLFERAEADARRNELARTWAVILKGNDRLPTL